LWVSGWNSLVIRTVQAHPDGPKVGLATLAESGDDLEPISDFLLNPQWIASL